MNKNIKIGLLIALGSWNFGGFMVSLALQAPTLKDNKWNNCVYESVGAFTNIGYVLACELYRTRFRVGE